MKVKMLRNAVIDEGKIGEAGKTVDVTKKTAAYLVHIGKARFIGEPTKIAPKDAK